MEPIFIWLTLGGLIWILFSSKSGLFRAIFGFLALLLIAGLLVGGFMVILEETASGKARFF